MASEWYVMSSTPTYNSGFEIDEFNNYVNDGLNELLGEESPIASNIQIVDNSLNVISEIRAVVQNNVSDNVDKNNERHIITSIGTLSTGQYIKYDNSIWLVTSRIGNNRMYEKGICRITNYSLTFQHPTTGEILSYPCVINYATIGSGLEEGKIITIGNSRFTIQLPLDDNTKNIREDKRFIMDVDGVDKPDAYKVTERNVLSQVFNKQGILNLTVEQDVFNPDTDNKALMIADYFEPNEVPEPVDPDVPTRIVKITHTADGNNAKLGLTYNFDAKVEDELGMIVTDTQLRYTIDNNYSGKVSLVDSLDGTCTVKVDSKAYDLVGNQFTLQCMDMYSGFSSSVTLTIVGMF